MAQSMTIQSLKDLLRYPFRQEGWQRAFLIGSALLFVGFFVPFVPTVFVLGYAARIMRRAVEDKELALPAWDDWGDLGLNGLRLLVIQLVYALPGLVILLGGFVLYMAITLVTPLLSVFAERTPEVMLLFPFLILGGLALLFISLSVGGLLLVAGMVPMPMATTHAVAENRLGAAFRLSEWWSYLHKNALGYLVAWIVVIGLSAILYLGLIFGYYTIVLCAVVPFAAAPVAFYVILVGAAIFGQTYRESVELSNDRGVS